MKSDIPTAETGRTIQEALKGIDKYLAMMNGRLEVLIMSDLPEYVKTDLATLYEAEQAASQILKGLSIFCHKSL